MLEVRPARSGQPTARIGGVYLHSPYDPQEEARRFVENSLAGSDPATVLLLGAELGHAGRAILHRFPTARLLAAYYDPQVAAHSSAPEQAAWQPACGQTLLDFLRLRLDELEAEGLAVLEWPASARLFPQASLEAQRQTAQALRELRGGLATTAAVGRRWLRNCLDNFLALDRVLAPRPPGRGLPVVIAASGPSLEEALPALARTRKGYALWALPSAAGCLSAHGLAPDLVVLTDPCWWAVAHLFAAGPSPSPLAMPLSAAAGAWKQAGGVVLIAQEAPYENALLEAAAYPAPRVLPQGTVAATALQLALRSTQREVVFAGLDFCFRDLNGHARPNLFERSLEEGCTRLEPLHHRRFAWALAQAPRRRAGGCRDGLPLQTYAGWFAARPPEGRLYRLLPSAVPAPGLRPLDPEGLARLARQRATEPALLQEIPPQEGYPDRRARRGLLLELLSAWRKRAARLPALAGELPSDPLLFSLAYHFDAARLAELRRARRTLGAQAARAKAESLAADLDAFLEGRRARVESSR
jgi:hypothetical protein